MSLVAATANSHDKKFEGLHNAEVDEFTSSSSILDFLNKERECISGVEGDDDASEIDVESLFEEINRLSDQTDERSVEEILREAEILINKQPMLITSNEGGCGVVRRTAISSSLNVCKNFRKVVETVELSSVISDESTPREMKEQHSESTAEASIEVRKTNTSSEQIRLHTEDDKISTSIINHGLAKDGDALDYKLDDKKLKNCNVKTLPKVLDKKEFDAKELSVKNKNQFSEQVSVTNGPLSPPSVLNGPVEANDKNRSLPAANLSSPNRNFSFSREHTLKLEIEGLQEKLKDTEERLQSLRVQHDSLSQLHRALRESQSAIQDESDILKLDVQHLTDCANALRAELKSARNDRDEALQVQNVLQKDLHEAKHEKKKAVEQSETDSKTIKDLQRQCKEMERILMRKHPDSVSALIVASKNPSGKYCEDNSASRRLLEQRIAQLESDAREQDIKAQKILANVQARFNSVQSKYETHIADLETQVLSLQEINAKLNEKLESQMRAFARCHADKLNHFTQTEDIAERDFIKTKTSSTQTELSRPNSSQKSTPPSMLPKKLPQPQNKMSVSHSDSTISAYHAAAKEDAHLLATIRGMRVDLALKDKATQRLAREVDECKKTIKKLQKEKDAMKSEKPACSAAMKKTYDPSIFAEQPLTSDTEALKDAISRIKLLELDYKTLHDKRLQDLKTLQSSHERELASCHETVRILQARLNERDEAGQKRRKVPIDYYALKAKVSSLERRHTEREQRLHMLVEALSKGRLNGSADTVLTGNTK